MNQTLGLAGQGRLAPHHCHDYGIGVVGWVTIHTVLWGGAGFFWMSAWFIASTGRARARTNVLRRILEEDGPERRMIKLLDICVETHLNQGKFYEGQFLRDRGLGLNEEVYEHWLKKEEERFNNEIEDGKGGKDKDGADMV
ncbi:hypothetical protein LZ554_001829 [Drepanopeziza brunnea f. sp. 'monogermtubi']|nr:hypothetical protein LZ554_001829 [Drepanopeziza brunnea f. sp. 'monogermtubi']